VYKCAIGFDPWPPARDSTRLEGFLKNYYLRDWFFVKPESGDKSRPYGPGRMPYGPVFLGKGGENRPILPSQAPYKPLWGVFLDP